MISFRKKLLLCVCLLCSVCAAKAQYDPRVDSVSLENTLFSFNVLTPGLSFEKSIANQKSIYLALGTGGFLAEENSPAGSTSSYIIVPIIIAQYRKFYNLKRRAFFYKKTKYNSANFFALHIQYQMDPLIAKNEEYLDYEKAVVIGPVWGLQRNGTLTFRLNLGLGVEIGNPTVYPLFDISVGLNISKLVKKK